MGVGGAAKLISNAEDNPNASGARLFPNAAAANRSIFYERGGQERSVAQVYSVLTQRYASAANSPATRSAMASAGVTPTNASLIGAGAGAAPIDNAAYLSSFPNSSRALRSRRSRRRRCNRASRSSARCFQAGERSEPVSPAVHELWGRSSSLTSVCASNVGCASNLRCASKFGHDNVCNTLAADAHADRPRAATARPLQRPQRRLQQLNASW